jgi:hypothetical protein
MTELRRLALPGAVLTGLLAVDLVYQPIPFGLAFRGWLVALGGLAAAGLVRASLAPYRQGHVEPIRLATRRTTIPERPAGLEEVERAVDFAIWNAADLTRLLRPLLREVAAHRLRTRRGVDLDRNPEAARLLLGEVAWTLIDNRPALEPEGRRTGASPLAIQETIQGLENL